MSLSPEELGIDPTEDQEVAELYQMYRYCKLFNCSPNEYESRPYSESQWLMQIDAIENEAVQDIQERASNSM